MPTECMECEAESSATDGVVVGTVEGDYGPICNECWSLFIGDETVLSRREADVAALLDMDLSHREIGNILDLEKSTVDTYTGRLYKKIDAAQRTVDELGHLNAYQD